MLKETIIVSVIVFGILTISSIDGETAARLAVGKGLLQAIRPRTIQVVRRT